MSDTMIVMNLIHADNLTPDQLMIGDLIKVADDILDVVSVECDATGDQYFIETQNEFGEKEITEYSYTDLIPLYVFIDEDEQLKVFLCASPHKNAQEIYLARRCEAYHILRVDIFIPCVLRLTMKKNAEELRRLMELRRSNAASAVPNKKKYNRKKCQTQMLQLKYQQKGE